MMTDEEWNAVIEDANKQNAFKVAMARSMADLAREHGRNAGDAMEVLERLRDMLMRKISEDSYR